MWNHVTLEVPAALLDDEVKWWEFVGFHEEPSYSPKYGARWMYQTDGLTERRTQLHLFPVGGDTPGGTADGDVAVVPVYGHVALVVGWARLARLTGKGALDFEEGTRYWGARRVMVTTPAGHRVELMEYGPVPADRRTS